MSAEPWTIKRLLDWTQQYLREKGFESARIEAEILLAHALRCARIDLYVRSAEEPMEAVRTEFRSLIKKRAEGMPVAYLVGKREFFRLSFEVTSAVLIPRAETEHLVVEALRIGKTLNQPEILDVGTGSGCIALSIAHQHPTAVVTAVDISNEALHVARRNAETHGLSNRVQFLQSDLFANLPAESTFSVIVSNPPYIAETEWSALPADVRDHEPRAALHGGADGLDVYRRLIAEAPQHLKPGGWLLLEIGHTQGASVRELLSASGRFSDITIHQDWGGHPRVVVTRCV